MTILGASRIWRLGTAAAVALTTVVAVVSPGAASISPDAAGAGTMSSVVSFTPSLPALFYTSPTLTLNENACVPLTWSLTDTGSDAAYVDDVGLFYAGAMAITGGGTASPCEQFALGGGTFVTNTSGTNSFGGSINCTGVQGSYERVGVLAIFQGSQATPATCTIDGQPVPLNLNGVAVAGTICSVSTGNPPATLPGMSCPYGNGFGSDISKATLTGSWAGTTAGA